jgi:hypothetical protein
VTTIRQLVTHLDSTLSVHVSPRLGSTIRQLHDWTGEFSATASGAPPDTSPASTSDEVRVKLTKVEADALEPDEARRALVRIYVILDTLVTDCGCLAASVQADVLPPPDHRYTSKLAHVQWQVNQIKATPPAKAETKRLTASMRLVEELANLCDRYRPCPPSLPVELLCVSHRTIGARVPIDSRHTSRRMCSACGQWCLDMGQDTIPADIVRLLDRRKYREARRDGVLRANGVKKASAS